MKFALRKKKNLCYYSIKIFVIKFDRVWKKRSHVQIFKRNFVNPFKSLALNGHEKVLELGKDEMHVRNNDENHCWCFYLRRRMRNRNG